MSRKERVFGLAAATLIAGLAVACGDETAGSGGAAADGGSGQGGDAAGASGPTGGSNAGGSGDGGSGVGGGPNVTPGGPVLFFSDLVTGPRVGNSDTSQGQTAGTDGAIVTVWGKNLGDTQGDSVVTVGGVEARVYSWGPATQGADLHARMGMQSIALQIPGGAPLGDADVLVTVGNVPSNTLPFTTRDDGAIYYLSPSGSDGASGSFGAPWESWEQALDTIEPGDIVYLLDGFTDDSGQFDTGFIGLSVDGAPDRPLALIAYPGATATVGGSDCEPTGHALLNNYVYNGDFRSAHWVVSKLVIESPADCEQDTAVEVGDGFRLIGNYISNPRTSDGCQSGSVQCGGLDTCGDDLALLGNEMADVMTANADTGSKQCHGFYISGNRTQDGLEQNREIGWNYIHDCANNRAINIYNESINGGDAPRAHITGHMVHDNWLENQRGIGLLLGMEVTGDNAFYNNVFVNTGLGPEFPDGGGFFPLQLTAGSSYDPQATTLRVYNNLVYGASFADGPDFAVGLLFFDDSNGSVTLDLQNNIFVSTEAGVEYVDPDSSSFGGVHNLWVGAGAPPSGETSPITGEPMFVDPASGDFHLQEGSAAKTGGTAFALVPLDFDGMPRPAEAVSIGPYQ